MMPVQRRDLYQNYNEMDPADEFDSLLQNYKEIIHATEGCGEHLQGRIDLAHAKLARFVDNYPELRSQLPEKVKLYNEGTGGIGTGSAGGNCTIS